MTQNNILAINTANEYLSLALEVAGERFSFMAKVGNKQSQHIINEINTLLCKAQIKPNELDVIAYIEGPGSFTGLRVGLSVAMGIGLGAGTQLVPIPVFALYAMVIKSQFNGNLVVGLDARLNQIYLAGINTQSLDYFIQPQVLDPEAIVLDRECSLVGDGFSIYHDRLVLLLQKHHLFNIDYPAANHMLDILQMNKYALIEPHDANLLYLRNKVAKPLSEQMQNKLISGESLDANAIS